jgi:hypothetical protein
LQEKEFKKKDKVSFTLHPKRVPRTRERKEKLKAVVKDKEK